ncbi:MAG: SUMF1/EgtB/PvdO family nonheme iron enzyme [Paludibacteraceae bacterium]|nr:SUMF1/EgtB/PvdO family nonheme iron enzyme [Paludibacteraceae bacterium]MBO7316840.1 SUMF1/EgtB/PvdO family nonheme iron enzyme [Paludibacteraceae bacterium]
MKKVFGLVFLAFCFTQVFSKGFVETAFDLELEMVYVEGGSFMMGNNTDKLREIDEEVVRKVTLDDYYIGKFPITVQQFAIYIDDISRDINSHFYFHKTIAEQKGGAYVWDLEKAMPEWKEGINWRYNEYGQLMDEEEYYEHPVVYISWDDALAFCEWLSLKTGKKYTLPTEAEWEYAARGGKKSRNYTYSGSNEPEKVGWFWTKNMKYAAMQPIGQKLPNELGIYDMSGNVYEWCWDWYTSSYDVNDVINPRGKEKVDLGNCDTFRRSIRGGSFINLPNSGRVTDRNCGPQDLGTCVSGFRIVCHK